MNKSRESKDENKETDMSENTDSFDLNREVEGQVMVRHLASEEEKFSMPSAHMIQWKNVKSMSKAKREMTREYSLDVFWNVDTKKWGITLTDFPNKH